ncbi:acyl-CoA dehydrogenase family protein [Novosphingobium pentaromativorans]|nr:acyl-CoA dehydrogenase family protein [Novosphingobium pentaromativorans]AIT80044.1 acyl-CoA dehydrogenase [Novosphingobium pentaromativorans US6-1]
MPADPDAFRTAVRAWLEENCPPGARGLAQTPANSVWGGRNPTFPSEDQRIWMERMAERGWTVPEWPTEYGGGGLNKRQAAILAQEMQRIKAHSPLASLGIWMLGPALLEFGTEQQKKKYLPDIARGKIRWAQGYSEPGAGSDLASVQTRGELKDGQWVVNGQKIWTTNGDKCDMIFALVRTEPEAPKHLGISLLLIDMDQPGVTTRPIELLNGDAHFTATFFDDATSDADNIVGERGQGWSVAKFLLGHERAMIGSSSAGGLNESLPDAVRRTLGVEALREDPALRHEIAKNLIGSWVLDIAMERLGDQARARAMNPHTPSVLKLIGTELNYRRSELMTALNGIERMTLGDSDTRHWLAAPANCIAGGSNEIQLNILAKRALELPEQK